MYLVHYSPRHHCIYKIVEEHKQNKVKRSLIKRYKQKTVFPKFQLILILHLQVMYHHDYIVFHCSIDYCVELSLVGDD